MPTGTAPRPLRIAFVVANYPPHTGGVEQHVAAVAGELTSRGHQARVFVTEPPGNRDDAGVWVTGLGRHLAVADIWSLPAFGAARALPQQLGAWRADVVSVHTRFFPATWLGIAAARRARTPVVLTEHGGGPVHSESAVVDAVARATDATLGRWAWRRADSLLAVSQRSAEFVRRVCGREPSVVGNGVDLEFWSAGAGRDTPRQQVLFVGRLVAEKGWRDFLRVVALLPDSWQAVIAGDGPDLPDVREAVAGAGLSGRVRVAGRLDREALRELYRDSILVNPSTAAEGLQTTLLEAAAAGSRIATYDVGGAAEVLATGAQLRVAPQTAPHLCEAVGGLATQSPGPPADLDAWSWPSVVARYERHFAQLAD